MPTPPSSGVLREISSDLSSALSLLRRLFDVRVTFFDLDGVEADSFDIKPLSGYCAARRTDPAFAARCLGCDRLHLHEAKGGRQIRIYRCHDGLIEGVIPLYGRDGSYLGAIMFGQLRPADDPVTVRDTQHERLRQELPIADHARLRDLAELLKWLAEHFAANASLRRPQLPWAETARRHIHAHLGSKLTIAGLARVTGRSPSFLSHRFPAVFGTSFSRYVRDLRLAAARRRLAQGATLTAVAAELGFCDRYHLSRVYRAYFGHPPCGKPTARSG